MDVDAATIVAHANVSVNLGVTGVVVQVNPPTVVRTEDFPLRGGFQANAVKDQVEAENVACGVFIANPAFDSTGVVSLQVGATDFIVFNYVVTLILLCAHSIARAIGDQIVGDEIARRLGEYWIALQDVDSGHMLVDQPNVVDMVSGNHVPRREGCPLAGQAHAVLANVRHSIAQEFVAAGLSCYSEGAAPDAGEMAVFDHAVLGIMHPDCRVRRFVDSGTWCVGGILECQSDDVNITDGGCG